MVTLLTIKIYTQFRDSGSCVYRNVVPYVKILQNYEKKRISNNIDFSFTEFIEL